MCSFRDSLLGYRFYVPIRERDKSSFLVQETKKTQNQAQNLQNEKALFGSFTTVTCKSKPRF